MNGKLFTLLPIRQTCFPLHHLRDPETTRLVAKLGGFLARKSDGEPGVQTIWRGLRRLDDLAAMWLLFHSFASPSNPKSYG